MVMAAATKRSECAPVRKQPSQSIQIREMMINGAATLGRNDNYPLESFKKGTRIWIKDPERVWIRAELLHDLSFTSASIRLRRLDDNEEIDYDPLKFGMPFLCNPDILLGKDDLTNLSYLHEPAVLNNLRYRFERLEKIYTYCGIVLVAINPYADCSQLYGDDVILVYRGQGKQVRGLIPHIYAISEEAFFDLREYGKNQSVIVSGESGAGKTVSAKFVMRYLTHVATTRHMNTAAPDAGIEGRVLASNPVMEAIGNAKTIRNDNSSRFGKFIQINFTERFGIASAEMKTYLLEKSRVVFQSTNERNYHIFYQMCAAFDHPLFEGFGLKTADAFHYTNQGDALAIHSVDDRAEFEKTIKAFSLLRISESQQREIFRILCGALYLGNVEFEAADGEKCGIKASSQQFLQKLCSDLFQIDAAQLELWLTTREIRAGAECVCKPLTPREAVASRDALVKLIYAHLFQWIVEQINESLCEVTTKSSKSAKPRFIGVLDIYGFETFDCNSFEQFCINYANEKLQQQFNQHVFKLEQAEYEREEISWVRIDYYDNQPCIDLIEGRPGLIDYLDEQCKTGNGSDTAWLGQLTNCATLRQCDHLEMPRFKNGSFIVKHFASDVAYTVDGFLEKNKDTASEQLINVIGKAEFKFLRSVIADALVSSSTGMRRKKTVAIQFRQSLKELISVLGKTRPHYVRCIKPNDSKEAFQFEPRRAIQQLRACGVLETVRISATGYPSRWSYADFQQRYRVLFPSGRGLKSRDFAEQTCQRSLEAETFALGKTKIFFRTGQVAHLEQIRSDVLNSAATKIQTAWRGFVARRHYALFRQSLRWVQAACRAFMAHRFAKYLQMHRASCVIQQWVRGFVARRRYERLQRVALEIQSRHRAALVRSKMLKLKYERSAMTIQRYYRGYAVRREQVHYIRRVILAQSCVRRWLARRHLRQLRVEARQVDHWQNLNRGLENKIISLQQRLDAAVADRTTATTEVASLRAAISRLEAELAAARDDRTEIERLEYQLDEMRGELELSRSEKLRTDAECSELSSAAAELRAELLNQSAEAESRQSALNAELTAKRDDADRLCGELAAEAEKRRNAENDVAAMRDQLLKNVDLLSSPNFSRVGSVRSGALGASGDLYDGTQAIASTGDTAMTPNEMSLIRQQQMTINEMRKRMDEMSRFNERLQNDMTARDLADEADKCTSIRAYDAQKLQELEMSNTKYRNELERFQAILARGGNLYQDFVEHLDKTKEENERLHEENIGLRALLAATFERKMNSSTCQDSGRWSGEASDDGASSVTNPELDEQLSIERLLRRYRSTLDVTNREIYERDQHILQLETAASSVTAADSVSADSPNSSAAADPNQRFVGALVAENLALQQKLHRQSDELAEARAYLRGYSASSAETSDGRSSSNGGGVLRLEPLAADGVAHSGLLEVFNVPDFSRIVICDLKPRIARQLSPGLPAYLLLAAFRYFDHTRDDASITGLFNAIHVILRDKSLHSRDMDVLVLWLVNAWRLLNLLRQYGGETEMAEWTAANTEKQNDWRLRHFNFEPIRNQLKLRVEDFYQTFMKNAVEPLLTPKITPGILHHDSALSLSTGTPPVAEDRPPNSGKLSRTTSKELGSQSLDDIKEFLAFLFAKLHGFGADDVVIHQVFRQIAVWMCSLAMNQLVFRKDLCTFEKAVQIKHNVTEIRNWFHEHDLQSCADSLEPLVQASHLMQSRKEESNLDTLCGEMTSRLTSKQIISILQHYTPPPGFEEDTVDSELIIRLSDRLYQRAALADLSAVSPPSTDTAIMLGTYLTPFDSQPFVPSQFPLDRLILPSCLRLESVARLI